MYEMHCFLTVLCVIIVSSSADHDFVVEIEDGKIQGTPTTNLDGELVYSFLGIPYGKPPTGDLRFKDPLPAEPWNGTFDGTNMGKCCIQEGSVDSEDCLNLNVHTRKLNSTELKPVMVWIYGGAFTRGCSQLYGPEFLLIEDIIFVTMNYRLGVLGFLSLDNATLGVPGNAGLKDQVMALKWVQKNIRRFGGDPNNVTIFGESAGGISVHYHVLSDVSKGLFQKAIIQSGSVLIPLAEVDRHFAMKFGKFLKLEGRTEEEILERFRNYSARELNDLQNLFMKGSSALLGPVIESPNDSQFITESGLDILKSGNYNKVPIMMGYCSNEGLYFEMKKRSTIVNDTTLEEQVFNLEVMNSLGLNLQVNDPMRSHIHRELINIYFNGTNAGNKYMLASDYYFINGIIRSAKLQANTSQDLVYLYRMSLEAGRNYLKKIYHLDDFPGVGHGDDLGYLFNMPGLEMGEQEEQYVRTFVKLWTNFAKYGNPTPNVTQLGIEWKTVDENQYFMDIGEKLTIKNQPEAQRMSFWQEIYPDVLTGGK